VSQDAIVRDKPADKASEKSPGADSTSSEPKGQDLSFAARISLDRTQMQIDDRLINLTPGMGYGGDQNGLARCLELSALPADQIWP
jgi:hemolysin D